MCGWYHSNGRKRRELKSLLMMVKDESERTSLRQNIKTTKIIASTRITAQQNRRGKGGSSDEFPLLGSKITADGDCSHEIRKQLLLGREVRTNLVCWKAETLTLLTKVCIVKAITKSWRQSRLSSQWSQQLWELDRKEGRMPKNWCLRTVVLEKTPKSPPDSKEIKQSILREINAEYSLEGLKLKLQYFGHLMWTDDWLEKFLMRERLRAEGEESVRGWDGWTASPMQWTWTWANSGRWWGTGRHAAVYGVEKSRTRRDD